MEKRIEEGEALASSTGSGLAIRKARLDDAGEVAALLVELGYPDNTDDGVGQRLATWSHQPAGAVLVAEQDGQLVGAVAVTAIPYLEREGCWGRIVALVVSATRRGQGIGRLLVEAAEDAARGLGCVTMEVTSARARTESHPFYRGLGYQEWDDRSVRYLKDLIPGASSTSFGARFRAGSGSSVPVMTWSEFRSMCPELADIGQRRLEERYLCLVGTLRRDGWPRISPVEPYLVDGELMLGMMSGSRKAADLLRDPRLVVHSIVTRWEADEGDVKLYGTAHPVTEPERRNALFQTMTEAHGWSGPPSFADDPTYHVYRVAIERVAYVRFHGSSWQDWTWDPHRGLSKRSHQ